MNGSKSDIRKRFLGLRKSQKSPILGKKSSEIIKRVLTVEEVLAAKKIGIYASTQFEVDTLTLIEDIKKMGLDVFLPKNSGFGDSYKFVNHQELVVGRYGILEPNGNEATEVDGLDVILVPGLAFDTNGGRIGYGKGIYDRLLGEFKGLKIGLAFDFQIIDEIPTEEWDIPMDMIVTEKRIIKVKG